VSEEFKIRVANQVDDISFAAGIEIVDTEYIMFVLEKPFTQMRPKEPGPAGDCTSFLKMHGFSPSIIYGLNCRKKAVIPKRPVRLRPALLYLFDMHWQSFQNRPGVKNGQKGATSRVSNFTS
jgi:hypothetical protein